MKSNRIVKWIILGLCFVFYVAILNFLLLLLYAVFIRHLPLFVGWLIVAAVEVIFLYGTGKYLYRTMFSTKFDGADALVSRFYTVQKYVAVSLGILLVIFCLLWSFNYELLYSFKVLFFLLLPLGAIAWGICKPEKRINCWIGPSLSAGIIIEMIALIVLFCLSAIVPRDFDYQSKTYNPRNYPARTEKLFKYMIPEGAYDIKVSGSTGIGFALGAYVKLQCQIPETKLFEFARAKKLAFKENDPFYNANPDTNNERLNSSSILGLSRLPDSFYYYNYRYRNNGGLTLLYDRKSQILYGFYSSN